MTKGKIMLVDDEKEIREIMKLQLCDQNYRILEAENGEQAIEILGQEDNLVNVGVIICDIRMPKVDGTECIDYLRPEAPGIPIVVATAYPDVNLAASLINKGVKEYLVKPVEKQKLIDTVNSIISKGKEAAF